MATGVKIYMLPDCMRLAFSVETAAAIALNVIVTAARLSQSAFFLKIFRIPLVITGNDEKSTVAAMRNIAKLYVCGDEL